MANPFSKGWKYLMSSLDTKIDENADPLVQIQQATEAAKKQHQEITEQAAKIIGNGHQLEMKLDRLLKEQDKLQDQARQALTLADKAAAQGDAATSTQYTNTAEVLASQLVAVDQEIADTTTAHQQAKQAAEAAQRKQQESEARLKEQLGQIDQLRSQVSQTKMQEASNQALDSLSVADDSVPTLDGVREKIERRYATALGAQELTENSVGSRMAEIATAGRDLKAASRLEEIRAQMRGEAGGELTSGQARAVEAPKDAAPEEPAEADVITDAPQADSAQADTPRADAAQDAETPEK